MKKYLSLLLAVLMIFTLTACTLDATDVIDTADYVIELIEDDEEPEVIDDDEWNDELSEIETEPEISEPDEDPEPVEEIIEDEPSSNEKEEEASPEPDKEPEEPKDEGSDSIKPVKPKKDEPAIDKKGTYTSKEDVALYIHTYGCLPSNFITKKEAEKLGWPGGSLEPYAPGKCIGGSYFGNYEGLLPEKKGRKYTECDIDTLGKSKRGAKRIIFSNDGLIYYTDDHYESFTLLYGEEVLKGEN